MSGYLKIGRLLPGENDMIRIMRDGAGEIGTVSRADVILTCGDLSRSRWILRGRWTFRIRGRR